MRRTTLLLLLAPSRRSTSTLSTSAPTATGPPRPLPYRSSSFTAGPAPSSSSSPSSGRLQTRAPKTPRRRHSTSSPLPSRDFRLLRGAPRGRVGPLRDRELFQHPDDASAEIRALLRPGRRLGLDDREADGAGLRQRPGPSERARQGERILLLRETGERWLERQGEADECRRPRGGKQRRKRRRRNRRNPPEHGGRGACASRRR